MKSNEQITIAMVDDKRQDYTELLVFFSEWTKKTGITIKTLYYSDGVSFLDELCNIRDTVTAVFIKVLMPDKNGISVAKDLCEYAPDIIKVFFSSTIEYSCQGFVVEGVRYILKDAKDVREQVFEALDHILVIISEQDSGCIDISTGNHIIAPIAFMSISSVSSAHNYTEIHTISGDTFRQRKSLNGFMTQFPDYFIRCNRKTYINSRLITEISLHTVKLSDGSTFRVTDSNYSQLITEMERKR